MKHNKSTPPRILEWLLSLFVDENMQNLTIGDFAEEYAENVAKSRVRAVSVYLGHVLIMFAASLPLQIIGRLSMLNNHLKIAIRSTNKNKGISFINIFGLAVGLACSILLFVYVLDELSFDTFHEKSDRIFRLESRLIPPDGSVSRLSTNPWPVGKLLAAEYPEIEESVYIRFASFTIKNENQYYYDKMYYTSNNFLDIFSFPVLKGDPEAALTNPLTMVITDEIEQKYFGGESALNRTLTLSDTLIFTITGVVHVPKNSSIQFDMLLSFETWLNFNPDARGEAGWGNFNMNNYLKLNPGTDIEKFNDKIKNFPMQKAGDKFRGWGFDVNSHITPVKDIYLNSTERNILGPSSSMKKIYFLVIIASLLLLIACFNFINLTTARSVERAKEVGIRKVVGSTRSGLVQQFLTESLLVCYTAMFFAFGIMALILPIFNDLTGKQYIALDIFSLNTVLFIVFFATLVGILAGFYPAFVLSRYNPAEVLKGKFSRSGLGFVLRKSMVVFQFVVTTGLIFCTLIIKSQLSYMINSDLGFNSEQIIVMTPARIPYSVFNKKRIVIKQALLENPDFKNVSITFSVPGSSGWGGQVCKPEGYPEDETMSVEYIPVDHDYITTFGIRIVAGRDFSKDLSSDKNNALLINESAVKAMKWGTPKEAIGKKIDSPSGYPRGIVVGVFKDYNHHSAKSNINAIVLDVAENTSGLIAIKTSMNDISAQLEFMQETWDEFFAGYPFDYFFMDEFFDRQYREETRISNIFGLFAMLAIVIACLGLFGLAAFSTSQRIGEIGIRKVLGASTFGITMSLIREYLILTAIASIVAIPTAYILMERWLTDFAYRIDIGIDMILIATFLTTALAVLTVSYRAVRAAGANPVDSMRYE